LDKDKGAADLIDNYKKNGVLDETAKLICNCAFHDKGLSTQNEVLDMMLDLDKKELYFRSL
jgi:hypothetical protein